MRRTYKCCKNKWQLRLINKTLRIWRVKPQDAFTTRPIDNCIAVSNVPVLVNWQRFSTTEHVLYDAVTRHLNTAFTLLFTVESLLKICGFGARVSYGGGGPRPLTALAWTTVPHSHFACASFGKHRVFGGIFVHHEWLVFRPISLDFLSTSLVQITSC